MQLDDYWLPQIYKCHDYTCRDILPFCSWLWFISFTAPCDYLLLSYFGSLHSNFQDYKSNTLGRWLPFIFKLISSKFRVQSSECVVFSAVGSYQGLWQQPVTLENLLDSHWPIQKRFRMPGNGIFGNLCLLREILLPKWCNFIKWFYMYTNTPHIHIIFTFK